MGRNDENELSEAEKNQRGLAFLQMLMSMSQQSTKQDEAELEMAKVEKRFYDAYIKVGFTAEQAIDLTKNKTNIFINKFMPDPDDKTDPRFKIISLLISLCLILMIKQIRGLK